MNRQSVAVLRHSTIVAMVMGLMLAGGCSSFERDWQMAAALTAPADDITGRWTGTWVSDASGHTGDLRAIIVKRSPEQYVARYHATYGELVTLTFEYSHNFVAVKEDNHRKLSGKADLGLLLGPYEFEGTATGERIDLKYKARSDHGTYTMRRPGAASSSP